MKKLIFAAILLLVSATIMSVASFAWFSMNTQVYATNMQVKATTGPSLVISASTNFTAGTTEVSKSGVDVTLMPATKQVDGMLDGTASHAALAASSTGLVYVANSGDVAVDTGLAKAGKTLYYAAATTQAVDGGDPGFYFDYVFYIAAEGANVIDAGKLVMNIDPLDLSAFDPAEVVLQAATVQTLVNDAAVGNPVALKDGVTAHELVPDLSVTNIPNGAPGEVSSAVKITLRVYIDGALMDTATTTYVKNISIVDLARAASFDAMFKVVTD